jgi:hypothetical protein
MKHQRKAAKHSELVGLPFEFSNLSRREVNPVVWLAAALVDTGCAMSL